jgi:hypothetical protein
MLGITVRSLQAFVGVAGQHGKIKETKIWHMLVTYVNYFQIFIFDLCSKVNTVNMVKVV